MKSLFFLITNTNLFKPKYIVIDYKILLNIMFYSLYIFLLSTLHNTDCVNQILNYYLGETATKNIC